MELIRPCRPGHINCLDGIVYVLASRGQVFLQRCARDRGLRKAFCTVSDGIFIKGLYILLAIVLLHDIFAPHPFAPLQILFDGDQSVLTLNDFHQSAAEFFEDDETSSVPSRRGLPIPFLSMNINIALHPFFHQLLLINKDERPPKV
jgi:hypothetical protein